jgi:hypothetical protein
MEFTLPEIPKDFKFDGLYILPDFLLNNLYRVWIRWRKWWGAVHESITMPTIDYSEVPYLVKSVPDFYYSNPDATSYNNKHFYFSTLGTMGPWNAELGGYGYLSCGYENFQISDISTYEQYQTVDRIGVILLNTGYNNISTVTLRTLAVALRKSLSISEALYAPCQGRTFNDTWDSRRDSTAVIENPVDLFEHVCRLQNWSEAGDSSSNFGKVYSPYALINTSSTDGGFDSTRLDDVKNRALSFQVFDEATSWTDVLKKDLCKVGWLANYADEQGQECVQYLLKTDLVPTDIITLGDDPQSPLPDTLDADTITPADTPDSLEIGTVVEPSQSNIFCEPFIRYCYNAATEQFDRTISIKQVHQAEWQASYTPGLDEANGQALWQRCHDELWSRSHAIEQPPSDLTDQYMICRTEDAIWFLHNWISWQTRKRIQVSVYYDKAKRWHIGRHIYLQLPHQTDNAIIETVIESIEKNKSAGYCSMNLIMLDGITDHAITQVQDTMLSMVEGADAEWLDSVEDQGVDGNKTDGMMV